MKKRVIALALCLVMLATCLGAGILAPTPVTLVDENGAAATSAAVPQLGRKTLTASYAAATETTGYQWQFSNDGDTWIDIYGETAQTCSLSYAKVKNMLDADGEAQLRCVVTDGEDERVSSAATVTVDYSAPASQPAVQAKSAPARAASYARSASTMNADTPTTTTHNVVINYLFENNAVAADPYTASLAAGSNFSTTVTFPTVQGYLPYLQEKQQNSLELNITNINENITYTVFYKPTNVNYTVIHYRQNLNDDNYTEVERETKQGLTNSIVPDVAKTYDGFYALLYEKPAIAADGSTVVEIYYDRYYYLMNFDLDGGYGVEPIYARYGAPIGDVGTPTKPGYSFTGWDKEIPQTMPAENSTYTAQWSNGNSVNFTVVFWYENADDDGYSYVGSATKTATVGTSVNSASYKNTSFENRDATHFTYNSAKAETVTVAGDGSTVLNVYFTRNTYTLTFKDGNIKIVCGKVEHEHSHEQCCTKTGWHLSCNSNKCPVGYEHEHTTGGWGTASCYKISDLTITAKYQADIHSNFPIKDGNKTIWWDVPNGCKSFVPGTYLASINAMPGENITFKRHDSESGADIYYYIETLNGEAGSYSHGGKNFKLYKTINIEPSGYLTYTEEFHDITGFTQWWSDPAFSKMEQGGKTSGINDKNYLCYTRNSYTLSFYNYNAELTDKAKTVQYEAPLSGYNFVPSYPVGMEPNAYKFAGWYTSPGCYDGSEVNWDTAKMPANDLMLYAKWVPVTHTVEFYLDETALDAGTELSTHPYITVPHGTKADPTPADPTNGSYTFIGWFYMENGVEKAFDFANMPVTKDMQVYGKWSSNVLKQYTIYYKIQGTDTEIAAPTTGSGLAGVTKTFEAKGGTDLYVDYQEGYFPATKSHSLTLDIENDANNVYTFWYVQKDAVPYTVKYLNKETGVPVATEKTVSDNRKAVVTETFVPVSGMMPDAYQKRLVVSAEDGAVNEIIFYYTEDTTHAYYKITHYTENLGTDADGNPTWTEYASSQAVGDIGTTYNADPMTIPGFTYDSTVPGTAASGELTASGLELKLYYTRNSYPYQVRYLEQGTGKQLHDPKNGTGKYGQVVSESAIKIANYDAVAPTSQTLNIRIEEGTEAKLNIITFYYKEKEVTINYQVVGPTGCGTVTPASETLKVLTGTAQGSTAAANAPTFRFVGWYKDEGCTQSVDSSWVVNNKLTPVKAEDAAWTDTTYYAKFEHNLTDLTIKKEMKSGNAYDANDMFIFTVKDSQGNEVAKVALTAGQSVTIKNLTVGETYTVTEDTGWSWRYSPDEATHSIKLEPSGNVVTVTNTLVNNNWLGASSYAINRCVKNIVTDVFEIVKNIFGN